MSENGDSLTYMYHLPFGGDLQELLDQPYITNSILKKLLQRRGTFIPSQEKCDMVSYIKMTLLRPKEFDYLMEIAITREERRKVRNDFDECPAGTTVSFATGLPEAEEVALVEFLEEQLPSCSLVGAPMVTQSGPDRYLFSFRIRRQNLASNWLKSEQIFPTEVEVQRNQEKGIVQTASWHTSDESRKAARFVAREIRKKMMTTGVITNKAPFTLRFDSFTNEERIAFLMKFTGSFDKENFSFEKLTDLSLKLDESVPCEDRRLSWMKDKVSQLNVSGRALQDTFFVTDIECRKHLHMWRFECRYKVDDLGGRASITICFEFGGYAKCANPSAPFQVSCTGISGRRYTGDFKDLERRIVGALNTYQQEFSKKGPISDEPKTSASSHSVPVRA